MHRAICFPHSRSPLTWANGPPKCFEATIWDSMRCTSASAGIEGVFVVPGSPWMPRPISISSAPSLYGMNKVWDMNSAAGVGRESHLSSLPHRVGTQPLEVHVHASSPLLTNCPTDLSRPPQPPPPSPVRGLLAWQRAHPQRHPQRAQRPRYPLSRCDDFVQARAGGSCGPRHLHRVEENEGLVHN